MDEKAAGALVGIHRHSPVLPIWWWNEKSHLLLDRRITRVRDGRV